MNNNSEGSRSQPSASDGFIVVAVLWILGALGVLVSIGAVYVLNSASAFSLFDDRLRTEALTKAAIELVSYRVQSAPGVPSPAHGEFDFRLGHADVSVDFHSENSLVDLNVAPKPLLAGLFGVLGASSGQAENYADMIVAWRDATKSQTGTAGTAPAPQNDVSSSNFAQSAELSLVKGLPAELVEKALPFVTVYSGHPQVNVLDAPREVIAALPGVSQERLNQFLGKRRASPEDAQALLALLKDVSPFLTNETSKAKRVAVRVKFDNGRHDGAEVVILTFDEGEEPYAVLSWKAAYEGGSTLKRTAVR